MDWGLSTATKDLLIELRHLVEDVRKLVQKKLEE